MIETARRDQTGALMHNQLGSRRSDVTSALRGSPNRPIRSMVDYLWTSGRSLRPATLRNVGEVCLVLQEMFPISPRSFMKLRGDIAASWRHREVVLRTGSIKQLGVTQVKQPRNSTSLAVGTSL